MSPELEKSIKERIAAGIGFEQIEAELVAAGYSQESARAAYAQVSQSATPMSPSVISSGTDLFKKGCEIAKKRLDVVALLGLSSATMNIIALQIDVTESFSIIGILAGIGLIAFVVYLLGIFAAYFIIAKAPAQQVTIEQGLIWSLKNILSLFWISVLVFFIVFTGLVLFIIPGIILSILLYFSHLAFIHDGKRGLQAVLRSRAVVIGRVVQVLKRLGVLILYSILIAIIVGILAAAFEVLEITSIPVLALFEICTQIITAFLTIVVIAAANQLYLELAQDRPVTEPEGGVVTKYKVMAFFGPIALISIMALLILLIGVIGAAMWGLADANDDHSSVNAVRSQVVFTEQVAEQYFLEQGSYTDVCWIILPVVTETENVECFSNETEWVLAAETNGEYWCTDVTGYGKQIPGPLNGRTTCLNLPADGEESEPTTIPQSEAATTTPDTGEVLPMM